MMSAFDQALLLAVATVYPVGLPTPTDQGRCYERVRLQVAQEFPALNMVAKSQGRKIKIYAMDRVSKDAGIVIVTRGRDQTLSVKFEDFTMTTKAAAPPKFPGLREASSRE